jgi:hypothetical protein
MRRGQERPSLSFCNSCAKQWGKLDWYMKCWADWVLILGFQVFEPELLFEVFVDCITIVAQLVGLYISYIMLCYVMWWSLLNYCYVVISLACFFYPVFCLGTPCPSRSERTHMTKSEAKGSLLPLSLEVPWILGFLDYPWVAVKN